MLVLQKQTCWGVLLCFLVVTTHFAHSGTSYADYENVRDLYELLLQKQMAQESLNHQMIRKSPRSPTVRLRFGKKSHPYISSQPQADERFRYQQNEN